MEYKNPFDYQYDTGLRARVRPKKEINEYIGGTLLQDVDCYTTKFLKYKKGTEFENDIGLFEVQGCGIILRLSEYEIEKFQIVEVYKDHIYQ
jgi:hypothetical protein